MYKQPVQLNPSNCFPSLPTLKIWVRKLSSPITSKRKIKTRPQKYLNQKKIKGNSRWYISLWKNSVFTVFFFHTRVRWLIHQLIAINASFNISTKYWDKCHKIKNKKEPRAFTLSEILWMLSGPRENSKSKFILKDIKIQ